jgi:hypothetical protein
LNSITDQALCLPQPPFSPFVSFPSHTSTSSSHVCLEEFTNYSLNVVCSHLDCSHLDLPISKPLPTKPNPLKASFGLVTLSISFKHKNSTLASILNQVNSYVNTYITIRPRKMMVTNEFNTPYLLDIPSHVVIDFIYIKFIILCTFHFNNCANGTSFDSFVYLCQPLFVIFPKSFLLVLLFLWNKGHSPCD